MSVEALYPIISPSLLLDFANTKQLDPRITFTRASTGTYYNGITTAKAEENLILYSQEINLGFFLGRATVTANSTTAPDGTTTADSLLQQTGQTVFGNCAQSIGVNAGACTLSCFAKPNGKNFLIIQEFLLDNTLRRTWFDLQNGTVGTTDAGHTASIVASTNGFYRCVITFTANAARTAQVQFGVADTNGSITVTDTGGLFLWGAQLEQRSSVTAYTPTTTQAITNYIPVLLTAASGVPRFQHNPTTAESLGLLVEEQRTNWLTYSQQLETSPSIKTNVTVEVNQTIAPDGTLTADKIVPNSVNTIHVLQLFRSVTAGAHTFSFYVKAGEYSWCQMAMFDAPNNYTAFINLATGALGTTSGAATFTTTSVGNGWYRVSMTATLTTNANAYFQIWAATANNVVSFLGNGFSGIYAWGAQLEANEFATSYIPTVASTVTRAADGANIQNISSFINQAECTVYTENLPLSTLFPFNRYPIPWQLADSRGSTNMFQYGQGQSIELYIGGTFSNLGTSAIASPKIAIAASVSSQGGSSLNGTVGNRSGNLKGSITAFGIGSNAGTSNFLNGTIKKIAFYPARVTNTQLQGITL
jgi:hypothetical protein